MIIFTDDKKEKHQSHGAIFTVCVTSNYYAVDVSVDGWGATKEEALQNLKIGIDDALSQIKNAEKPNV